MQTLDLREMKVITESDLATAVRRGYQNVSLSPCAILTPLAREFADSRQLVLVRENPAPTQVAVPSPDSPPSQKSAAEEALLNSAQALALKEEIIRAGRKLWERQYVDGNGGNISARLDHGYLICTPANCSKADLTPDDFALVDSSGRQVAGHRPATSEILLHAEIYRSVPEAKAVLHCHPPHATAYTVTGTIPPGCMIPENEVLVGRVALAPYETPGTPEFARTVLPYAHDHNVILLQNHGVVCWSDTVTHAEWCVEVLDTYCRTILLASHLNMPLVPIPNRKAIDLLEIKKKLGLPDARYGLKECQLCDVPEFPEGLTVCPRDRQPLEEPDMLKSEDIEDIVRAITDRLMAVFGSRDNAEVGGRTGESKTTTQPGGRERS
jgi:L-fuculose-phosphate aldolase